ncbi:MAG: transposase domain-containing protein [Thermoguttaceae bacterium]
MDASPRVVKENGVENVEIGVATSGGHQRHTAALTRAIRQARGLRSIRPSRHASSVAGTLATRPLRRQESAGPDIAPSTPSTSPLRRRRQQSVAAMNLQRPITRIIVTRRYTLVQSARRNCVDVWPYLTDVLRRIAAIAPGDTAALEALLPDRWLAAHPEHRLEQREEESREAQARRRQKRAERRIAVAQ